MKKFRFACMTLALVGLAWAVAMAGPMAVPMYGGGGGTSGTYGNVTGPASSTDGAVPSWNGTTGRLLNNNSGVTIGSHGNGLYSVVANGSAGFNLVHLGNSGVLSSSSILFNPGSSWAGIGQFVIDVDARDFKFLGRNGGTYVPIFVFSDQQGLKDVGYFNGRYDPGIAILSAAANAAALMQATSANTATLNVSLGNSSTDFQSTAFSFTAGRHMNVSGGTAPTIKPVGGVVTGNSSMGAGSTDFVGYVNTSGHGAGTVFGFAFGTTYANTPVCVFTNGTSGAVYSDATWVTNQSAGFASTVGTAYGTRIRYQCVGLQ